MYLYIKNGKKFESEKQLFHFTFVYDNGDVRFMETCCEDEYNINSYNDRCGIRKLISKFGVKHYQNYSELNEALEEYKKYSFG